MPRTNGVYSPPAGTKGVPNTTVRSVPYNSFVDDLAQDANAARPITAGGTGATNATKARENLGAIGSANMLAAPLKETPVDGDSVVLLDSEDKGKLKRTLWSKVKSLSYGPQTLTLAQQGQARANIGAGILAGFRNQLINGDFPINQRGNRNLAPGENMIVLDRWYVTNNTNQTVGVSQQAFAPGQTDVPGEPAFYLKLNFPIAPTTGTLGVTQRIESVRTLANKKATVTAYTSGPSSNGGTLTCSLGQNFGVGGSPSTSVITPVPLNIGTVFDPSTRKRQGIIDMPSIAGKTIGKTSDGYVALAFTLTPRATGNYSLAHVSVVEGDATAEVDPFSPRHIQQEFALCQRYYTVVRQTYSGNVTTGFTSFNRMRISPPMRASPTVSATVVTQSGFSSTIANASASAETCIVGVNGTNTQGAGEFTIDSRLDDEL